MSKEILININKEEYDELEFHVSNKLGWSKVYKNKKTWGKSWTQEDKDEMAIRVVFLETLLDKLHKAKGEK
tara:strand:+ start:341 stop:553 length:213 start_codon:yes stop_codon:yes gene_type:complete